MTQIYPDRVRCVVFDFGFTLSSDLYFKVSPPDYPHWRALIQQLVFDDRSVGEAWMIGALTTSDIAAMLAQHIPLPLSEIVSTMEQGVTCLSFNRAVWQFALSLRDQGLKAALVTANMDIFTKVVVPAHNLNAVFDVIINSSDYHELNKANLWPLAFAHLGPGFSYENSLLIEDGEEAPSRFRSLGGYAYQYEDDTQFLAWLRAIGWPST